MMPVSALHSVHFKPAELDDPASAPADDASASGSSQDGVGQSLLPLEVDKLLQALLKQLDSSSTGDATASPGAGSGQSAGAGQGGSGIDPQLAEMLAYIARAFEAMLQQQQSQDDGSGGASALGGAAAPPTGGVGAAPEAMATSDAAHPSQATATPAAAAPLDTAPATGLSNNDGGVPQAAAIDGVAPNATKVVNTGAGTDRIFNVTDDTNTTKSFEYETEGQKKAVMTLAPGETEAFKASSKDLGVRIENSDAQGNVKSNEQLFETGGADNGQAIGVSNDDISNVDGDKDVDGNTEKMTDTLSDGKKAGDGDAIRPYQNPTDDAAAMGLAGDSSMTSNIVVSN